MKITNWTSLIGALVLLSDADAILDDTILEARVLAVSPAGRVKLHFDGAAQAHWWDGEEFTVLEILEAALV